MLISLKSVSLVFAVGLALTGCGVFGGDDDGSDAGTRDLALIGTWETDCYTSDQAKPENTKEVYRFSPVSDFSKSTVLHTDENCKDEAANHTISGTYDITGKVEGKPNTYNINFTVTKATLKPESEDQAKNLNENKVCDRTDWKMDQEVDITGLDCLGGYANGDVIFDIYERDSDKALYFGKPFLFFDREDPSSRPVSVDTSKPFFKD